MSAECSTVSERRGMAGLYTLSVEPGTIRIATKQVTFCGLCALYDEGCVSLRLTCQFGFYTFCIISCYPKN